VVLANCFRDKGAPSALGPYQSIRIPNMLATAASLLFLPFFTGAGSSRTPFWGPKYFSFYFHLSKLDIGEYTALRYAVAQ